ncbi:hypothetical protein Tco_1181930 [Tanacetum coccineum]
MFERVESIHQNRSSRFNALSEAQVSFLSTEVTMEDLKEAVWCCGNDKSLGPDEFTFSLFKRHWDVFKNDILAFIKEFLKTSIIPPGCNSSFIILIPEIYSPMRVNDYRPISLIGIQYKIIAKMLALRLA